jgi:hypothetical protein
MRRPLALIPTLFLLLPLAACGGRTEGTVGEAPTAQNTTAPTVAAAPTSTPVTRAPEKPAPTGAKVSTVAKAKPSGSRDPRWGTQYAILKSSNLAARQITYDLIEWYDGKEARKACAEDGRKPAENDYCQAWYIRNNNRKLRTLTVDPDAPIRLTVAGELKSVDLKTFLSNVDNGNVIRFDIEANRIIRLEHVYLP